MTETINKPTSLCFFLPSLSTYRVVTSYHTGNLSPLWSLKLPFLLNSKTSHASCIDSKNFWGRPELNLPWKWKMKVKLLSRVWLFVTPQTVDYQFSIHGIFQARVLEWVAISFWGIFPTQGSNPGLLHCRQMLYLWATREAQKSSLVSLILNLEIIVYWAPILWKIFWEWGYNCEYDIVRTVCGFCM